MLLQRKTGEISPNTGVSRQHGVALIIDDFAGSHYVAECQPMRGTNLDAKIAANYQHKQLSFQAAENAFARLTGGAPEVVTPTAYPGP